MLWPMKLLAGSKNGVSDNDSCHPAQSTCNMNPPPHSGRPAVPAPLDAQGHRARLWPKFQAKGLRDGFHHGYEKLEFILTFTIPRADAKAIARALLQRFHSLKGVFSAAPHELATIPGVGPKTAHFLAMFRQLTLAMDEEQLTGQKAYPRICR